ncbi:MAG: hypothetical protein ACYCQL_08035 [Acidithiobacillus sp.]
MNNLYNPALKRDWQILPVPSLDVNDWFRCDPVIPIRRPGMINH